MDLPRLGVGMIYLPGLEPLLEAGQGLIDVIEIEPQIWTKVDGECRVDEQSYAVVHRYPQHKLVHGVGFPVGGTREPEPGEVAPFVAAIERLGSPWASEHLSFNRVRVDDDEYHTGFLMPPVQTPATVAVAAANIRALQRLLPVPFAFETGVNYLRPRPGELSDGAFFGAVAETAECGILLDLHNLWCNERNGRQPVLDALAELPLKRVWEVHLAGGQELDGYWLDAHSGPVPDPLLALAAEVLPALPALRAVTLEVMPDYLISGRTTVTELVDQLGRIRELWDGLDPGRPRPLPPAAVTLSGRYGHGTNPSPSTWEAALGAATTGMPLDGSVVAELAADPGTRILRELVGMVRAGIVVDCLRYTFRLILLTVGENRFRELLTDFWSGHRPEPFPHQEAAAFARHAVDRLPALIDLPALAEYELAVLDVCTRGGERRVRFGCEPTALLAALDKGGLPEGVDRGDYEVVVTP
jgi:uncharacterized protein